MQQYRYRWMPEDLISPFQNMGIGDQNGYAPSNYLNYWYRPRDDPQYYLVYDAPEHFRYPHEPILCQNCGAAVETRAGCKTSVIPQKITQHLRRETGKGVHKATATESEINANQGEADRKCKHPMCASGCRNRCKQLVCCQLPTKHHKQVTTVPPVDKFKVSVDVSSFEPEDIQVKITDRKLAVDAKKEIKDPSGTFLFLELHRQYYLPDHVNPDDVTSYMDDNGILTIEASRVIALKGPQQDAGEAPTTKAST